MGRRKKFKYGENAFFAYPNILVKSEKFDLNAFLISVYSLVCNQWCKKYLKMVIT